MKFGRVFAWLDPVILASLYLASQLINDPTFAQSEGLYPLIILGVVYGPVFLFRFQNRLWQYASINDIKDYVKIILVYIVGSIVVVFFNRSLLDYGVLILAASSYLFISRFALRFIMGFKKDPMLPRTLIYGAGESGNLVYKESEGKRNIVAFLDDNHQLSSYLLHGKKIYPAESVADVVAQEMIEQIIIAIPSLSQFEQLQLQRKLSSLDVAIHVVTSLEEVRGDYTKLQTKPIRIEDVLGRPVVKLDNDNLNNSLADKVVLITGAGGSIGSELCRQVIQLPIKHLVMIDQYENGLFEIEQELKNRETKVTALIASVQDKDRLSSILSSFNVDTVYHAAAHKHVPLMQESPEESVKNNVWGTLNLLESCNEEHVGQLVIVSTDKAVHPTSYMGASKRMVELLMSQLALKAYTKVSAVRFGNVLGSNGSVIPIFERQIKNGGPVTVTHPEMTRYFMTIPEACQLILLSSVEGQSGDIFVLDMGEPIKISSLAEKMILLSGYKPHDEIKIEYIGIRPGEKLFEELIINQSDFEQTSNGRIFIEKIQSSEILDLKKIRNMDYVMKQMNSIINGDSSS